MNPTPDTTPITTTTTTTTTTDPVIACENCDARFTDEQDLDVIDDLHERVDSGEIMPCGQCPKCGCLCHYDPLLLPPGVTFADLLRWTKELTARLAPGLPSGLPPEAYRLKAELEAQAEAYHAEQRAAHGAITEPCDECGAEIPTTNRSMVSRDHLPSCSLFPSVEAHQ